ncbi:hypothetical protein MKQ70_12515 [Chitinophaga sedimenti]|uniref:hypothetical protein n=1 Tax=Chitinophaga sedimenti TaxID=2033606 RepID=UPI002003D0DD|nr:hypothetical protein [Chitinophaga sedimenti]MCK7555795.1 hypothetical protein [Chitinophaga sedimenti]
MIRKGFNAISSGTSGKFSDQVTVRNINGKEVICKNAPKRSGPPSEKQLAAINRFKAAAAYGYKAIRNAALLPFYESIRIGGNTAYNMAHADYMKAPEIDVIDTTGYSGEVGTPIIVDARDNGRVTSVQVEIFSAAGDVIESGAAVEDAEAGNWRYVSTVANATPAGCRLVATATDMPGNETSQEVVLQ